MDNCCDTDRPVGGWVGEQLYDRRFHSHPVGDCHYCIDTRVHQWTQITTVQTQKNINSENSVHDNNQVE